MPEPRPYLRSLRRIAALLARPLRRVLDLVPLTPLGALGMAAAALALQWVAYRQIDLVVLVACFAALGMGAIAVVLVISAAIALKLSARAQARGPVPAHIPGAPPPGSERTLETARSLPTGFSLPSMVLVPLIQVRWEWLAPEAGLELTRRGFRLREDATLRERGQIDSIERRIVVRDAFGIAQLAVRQRAPVRMKVLPHAGALRQMPLLVSMAGGDEVPHPLGLEDGDRVELRRYAPGDPARHIHWKVFGRTRRLMVRVPERALSRARRTISYLVAGPDDEASAGAARVAIESGALGGEWVFGADGSPGETSDVGVALDSVVRSVRAKASGAAALAAFVERAERLGPASLVLFVPPRPGPWLDRVLSVIRSRAQRSRVVIAVDGLDASSPPPLWWRVLARRSETAGAPAHELDAVLRALSHLRVSVVVLDRRNGRRLGTEHRNAALARAA